MGMLEKSIPAAPSVPKSGNGGNGGKKSAAGKITPESVRADMHLTPKQAAQMDRIVLAGKKVLYSPQSHKMMIERLAGDGSMGEKMGKGVAGLMSLLWMESKQSLPPELLIPAGMVLVAEAAGFVRDSGQAVTDQDIGQGMEILVSTLMQAGGVNPEKVKTFDKMPGAAEAEPMEPQGVA